jgi:flagellar hook-basal body complex protein FliE
MQIFNSSAYISASAAKNYAATMVKTHPKHMDVPDSPYSGSGNNILNLGKTIGADGITRDGTFEHTMLQALDKVSGAQHYASQLEIQGIIDPDSVDAHDITIAQAEAGMALDIARNVLNRLVQGWRDIINTR